MKIKSDNTYIRRLQTNHWQPNPDDVFEGGMI